MAFALDVAPSLAHASCLALFLCLVVSEGHLTRTCSPGHEAHGTGSGLLALTDSNLLEQGIHGQALLVSQRGLGPVRDILERLLKVRL